MPVPQQKDIELPLLHEIEKAGGAAKPAELYDKVAAHFQQMTAAERTQEKISSGANKFEKWLNWARFYLARKGQLSGPSRGTWTITDRGRERLRREWLGGALTTPTSTIAPALPATPAPSPPPNRHEQLKKAMVEIGDRLGYHVETEKRAADGAIYTHDVLWRKSKFMPFSHVIEVCEGGLLPKDFHALLWARDNCNTKGVLVVTDDRDFEKAEKAFTGQSSVVVVKAETVEQMHKVAQDNPEFLRFVFGK